MLRGGWLWLAALWLAGGCSPPPPGGVPHDHPGGIAYDHEAFLGPEEARAFEQLPPEESQRRLGLLVGLMDEDGDGGVSLGELRGWISRTQRRAQEQALAQAWGGHDRDGDGRVTWDEYREQSYGPPGDEEFGGSPQPERHRALLARDERRFRAADEDGDGAATRREFAAFLRPQDFEHMAPVLGQEMMEEMDKDGDGFIQEDEYIAELYTGAPGVPEPPWVQREREQFTGGRDRDGDGRLDGAELGLWLQPPRDWAGAEAAHLLRHSDSDQDGQLTREEILGQWELFVGSRATDYGNALEWRHDEL